MAQKSPRLGKTSRKIAEIIPEQVIVHRHIRPKYALGIAEKIVRSPFHTENCCMSKGPIIHPFKGIHTGGEDIFVKGTNELLHANKQKGSSNL